MGKLVEVFRGKHRESTHRGDVVVCDAASRVHWCTIGSGFEDRCFMRSTAKPFQAIALLESGAAARYRLDDRALALACASHTGSFEHLSVLAQMLSPIEAAERLLRCGSASDPQREPRRHMCSGQHAGLLLTCKHRRWPLASYGDLDHPLQAELVRIVREYTGSKYIELAPDGCGIPSFLLPLRRMATAYARLVDPDYWQDKELPERIVTNRRIARAMTTHPELGSGPGKPDAALMRAAPGKILCKQGAEGIWCAAFPDQRLGLAIKVEDGSSRALPVVMVEVLRRTGLLEAAAIGEFAASHGSNITDAAGVVVGRMQACFEFERIERSARLNGARHIDAALSDSR